MNYIIIIFFIDDIMQDIVRKSKEKIKQQKFTLSIDTIKFSIGKEYKEKDLGEDYVHCRILKNNVYMVSQAILSSDTLYLGKS